MRLWLLSLPWSASGAGYKVDNWRAAVSDHPGDANKFVATFEWDHDAAYSLALDRAAVNPKDGVCSDGSVYRGPDGLTWPTPRFYPVAVPPELTRITGIQYASVDWTPCGHKNVVICHAESHYDFHLYYIPQAEAESAKMACINSAPNCPRGPQENAKFFNVMRGNLPARRNLQTQDFCVDPTSAIAGSGIHYGDRCETLNEWQTPVSIIGSHDCKLTFFEPMISWRWIIGMFSPSEWPTWESGEIEYNEKRFGPLITKWRVDVSRSCKDVGYGGSSVTPCHIKITAEGVKCPPGGCAPPQRECGAVKSCLGDEILRGSPSASLRQAIHNTTAGASPTAATTCHPRSGTSSATFHKATFLFVIAAIRSALEV